MEEQGPFDRMLQPEAPQQRDRTALIVVAVSIVLGAILLILVLPPISILDSGDGGGPAISNAFPATARDEMPAPPPGYEPVSALYDLGIDDPVARSNRLTVSLSSTLNTGEPLVLFTYTDNEEWRRLGTAEVTGDGEAASGEVAFLPTNVAAFRQSELTHVVTGVLPAGAEIDERAQGALSTLNPAGLTPAPDGQLSGGPLQVPAGTTVPVAPSVRARSQEEIDTLNAILASPDLRATHVQALLALARDGNYAGLDLDYRFDPTLEAEFVTFVQELSDGLTPDGRMLTLSLPMPLLQGTEWDTQGFDLAALGPLVEAFRLEPEAEQDVYYQRTEAALSFLVGQVTAGKLLLTVSPLSRERAVDGMHTLTLTEALGLASVPVLAGEGGAVATDATVQALGQNLQSATGGLHWDDTARAVTFSYTGPGGERTVWLANLFSETFKLDLAQRYNLRGVAVEDVSRATEDANVWPVVARYAASGDVVLVTPNGELLQPHWAVSAGTIDNDAGVQVQWHAPAEPGTYTLTLIVSDGILRVGQELAVPVEAPAGAVTP